MAFTIVFNILYYTPALSKYEILNGIAKEYGVTLTIENIVCIKKKTGTQDAPAWVLLEQNYAAINDLLRKARRTITYNDFYYTNMVVAKDKSSALMFDYNLLGKGYAYR